MPKVIFINRYYYPDHSATAQLLTDLAETLASSGQEIHVVASRLLYEESERLAPSDQINGVTIHRVWTSSFGRVTLLGRAIDYLTFYVSAFFCLLRLTKRDDIVVAKTDPPIISVVAAVVTKIRRAKLINWVQDLFPEVAQSAGLKIATGPIGRMILTLRNWSLKVAKCNIVLGEIMSERLQALGISENKIRVIPNWVIDASIRPIESKNNHLRRKWGFSNQMVVGYSGNLGTAHDYEFILKSVIELRDDPSISFLFVGGGSGMGMLKKEVSDRGITNAVFKPYQPISNLAESLSVPDVHIISLRPEMEGLIVPSKLYGVLAVNKPILNIGCAEGEIGRLITQVGIGKTIDPRQNAHFSNEVITLFTDLKQGVDYQGRVKKVFAERFAYGLSKKQWADTLLGDCNV